MVNVQISVSVKSPRIFRRLKKWGQFREGDSYSVYERLVDRDDDGEVDDTIGQFSLIQLYMLDEDGEWIGGWSANQEAANLSNSDMLKIAALQVPDEFSLDAKMNTLMFGGSDKWGCPMRATYSSGANWRNATNIKQISAAYAGQLVEILETRTFYNVPWQDRVEASVPMSRIKVFTPADWGKTHFTNPEIVHIVTVVDDNDIYGERLKGIVYLPLITKTQSCWVFDRWLE